MKQANTAMDDDRERLTDDNRQKKIQGRAKRRKYVQGTRAYTHAMTNSLAKRAAKSTRKKVVEPDND
jgi:hypothetical protein